MRRCRRFARPACTHHEILHGEGQVTADILFGMRKVHLGSGRGRLAVRLKDVSRERGSLGETHRNLGDLVREQAREVGRAGSESLRTNDQHLGARPQAVEYSVRGRHVGIAQSHTGARRDEIREYHAERVAGDRVAGDRVATSGATALPTSFASTQVPGATRVAWSCNPSGEPRRVFAVGRSSSW
jgi:hypothetical protein